MKVYGVSDSKIFYKLEVIDGCPFFDYTKYEAFVMKNDTWYFLGVAEKFSPFYDGETYEVGPYIFTLNRTFIEIL